MALVQRLQPVHDRMRTLAASFGIPQYQNVVIVTESGQQLLTPQPLVRSMTDQDIMSFMANDTQINGDDRWLEGVSRIYSDSVLSQASFILNATRLNVNSPWVGINADVLFIDRNRLMDWKILVRPFRKR